VGRGGWQSHRSRFDNGELEDCFVRIDVRNISHAFIIGLLRIAHDNDWLMPTQDQVVLRPDVDDLLTAIRGSDCSRFVSNPAQFVRDIQNGRNNLN